MAGTNASKALPVPCDIGRDDQLPRGFDTVRDRFGRPDRVEPAGGEARHLTNFTFAPTLTARPGFRARPELRLCVTHPCWNKAANHVVLDGLNGFGDGRTTGTSNGLQAEVWCGGRNL